MIYLIQVDYSGHMTREIVPIGCLHVGSALKNAGYEVRIIHCNEKEIDRHAEEAAKAAPLWIGFSVMTGPQTMHSAWMAKKIKEQINAPVIWGGIHPSILPEQCLMEDYIDIVITGEGEETAVELTQRLESRKDLDGVLGLGYKAKVNGEAVAVMNERRPFMKDLDADKYRLQFDLIDVPQYLMKAGSGRFEKVFSYKTSRGCPYSCGFCYNKEFNMRKWRAKSAERVIEDISYLKKQYGIDGIKFYDDEFYINRKRALTILDEIGIPAKTDIRIDMITDELAAKLKDHNIFDILIGIESGSDRILGLLNKGITVDQIKHGVRILAKHNLKVGYSAITGIPTETKDELNATIDLILWIHNIHNNISVTVGPYLPYPGSDLYQWTLQQGFVPPATTEGWGTIDRWRKDLSDILPWIKDNYVYYLREYMKFFAYNLSLLNKLAEFRLRHKFIKFPIDIAVVHFLYEQAIQEKNWFGRALRKTHQKIVSR